MDKTIVSKKFVQRGDGSSIRRTIKFENELDKELQRRDS